MIGLFIRKLICLLRGHDYGAAVAISPSFLTCCHRCGRDIKGREIDDLEPMTDDDWDLIEAIDAANGVEQ